jgi:GDP-L-fucose synthase
MNKNSTIFLAGHNGLVGSAVLRKLKAQGFKKIITIERKKIDLRNYKKLLKYLKKKKNRLHDNGCSESWWNFSKQ